MKWQYIVKLEIINYMKSNEVKEILSIMPIKERRTYQRNQNESKKKISYLLFMSICKIYRL